VSIRNPPHHSPTLAYPPPCVSLTPRLLPRRRRAAPAPPAAPSGGVHGFAVWVGTQAGNTVVARTGPVSDPAGTVNREDGERGAFACAALLEDRPCAASSKYVGAGPEPQPSLVDPRRLLVLTSGGDGSRKPPLLATAPPEVVSCRAFLDGLKAANYVGDEEMPTLEAIARTILFRGEGTEIRLTHRSGRAQVCLRQRPLRNAEVKNT